LPFSDSGCAGFESGDGDSDGHGAGAAGTAAALAVAGNKTPREVDTSRLQEILRASGGILQAPDADIEVGNPDF